MKVKIPNKSNAVVVPEANLLPQDVVKSANFQTWGDRFLFTRKFPSLEALDSFKVAGAQMNAVRDSARVEWVENVYPEVDEHNDPVPTEVLANAHGDFYIPRQKSKLDNPPTGFQKVTIGADKEFTAQVVRKMKAKGTPKSGEKKVDKLADFSVTIDFL